MKRCISLGNWNKNYLFIIGSAIALVIYNIITGHTYYEYKFHPTYRNDEENISGHIYIHQCFYYFIIFVFAFLFYIYEEIRDKNRNKIKDNLLKQFEQENFLVKTNSQDLIYKDIYEYPEENQKISDFFAFIIIFLYILVEQAHDIFKRYFVSCDFWMFELIIMAFLNMRMFKINIYKHQIIAIILTLIPVILKFSTIVLLFQDPNNKDNDKDNIINYKYNNTNNFKVLFVVHDFILPIAIVIYLLIITLKAYFLISIKKIMDLKYVSLSKILICYGVFGTFLLLIFSMVASFMPCATRGKDDNYYGLSDYQCKLISDNGKNITTYVENIFMLSEGVVWKHSLIIIFGGIAYGFYKLFIFQIVEYLTPIHVSFSLPIHYFMSKLIFINQTFKKELNIMKYTSKIYWIDLISDLAAIFEFLIYLEIIELNFYGFNLNLRKNIIMRSKNDSKQSKKSNNLGEFASEISDIDSNRTISFSEVYD